MIFSDWPLLFHVLFMSPMLCIYVFFSGGGYGMFVISSKDNLLAYNILEENIGECTITYLKIVKWTHFLLNVFKGEIVDHYRPKQ